MRHPVTDFVEITRLPTEKRPDELIGGRGYFAVSHDDVITAHYHNGEPMRFLGFIQFPPGVRRGDHFHVGRTENLLVVMGTLRARFKMPDRPEIAEFTLARGERVSVSPGCVHSYLSPEGAFGVEFCPEPLTPGDTVKHEIDWEVATIRENKRAYT